MSPHKNFDMKTINYPAQGTCSKIITVTVDEGRIVEAAFIGGCHGNTQGIAALVKGMPVDEAIRRLEGIDCHGKGTSCPDQLAQALKSIG